jgi:hypothetical protein
LSILRSLLYLVCLLALFQPGLRGEVVFFEGDHYKAVGSPKLVASVANPQIDQGRSILRVALANVGALEKLIPVGKGKEEPNILEEISEEGHDVDAVNVTAVLSGSGHVTVRLRPVHIDYLPSGSMKYLEFDVTAVDEGPADLTLDLSYEHQVDVTMSDGLASPLYMPANSSLGLEVSVKGQKRELKIEGVSAHLSPGSNGTLLALVGNPMDFIAKNCTARLAAAPPFSSGGTVSLGDMAPGQVAVAKFWVSTEDDAPVREYLMACELGHDGGTTASSFPVELSPNSLFLDRIIPVLTTILLVLSAGSFFFLTWNKRGRRRLRW